MKSLTAVVLLSGLFFTATSHAVVDTELTTLANQIVTQQLEQIQSELTQQLTQSVKASLQQFQLPLMQVNTADVEVAVQPAVTKAPTDTVVLPE
jgi:signal transduction histidine kinase